ncbi:OLC1v1029260C1 [Oldenlandia corymbosa var. corymbosa]|uniref:OLC1v1029260C1 n=1 Tax=Oldenlandia corymbosa var. corymbosa TaxID=529605 RepID=A0AAV1CDK2_OLDCO|nr:OLC1v1029260C1 [Oldenlandia corymbosa var. corymbosa]
MGSPSPTTAAIASDWRTQIQPGGRERVKDELFEKSMRIFVQHHHWLPGAKVLSSWKQIMTDLEEKIYREANSEPEYMTTIAKNVLIMETEFPTKAPLPIVDSHSFYDSTN